MKFLSNLFNSGAKEIIDSAGGVIDKVVTNDHERSRAKAELSEIVMQSLNRLHEAQRSLIEAEMQGNWLQRSWRPIVMLVFTTMIVLGAFMEIPYLDSNSRFWGLLELGLGGYIIGRSVEKVSRNVTSNIDLPFVRKKDRKDLIKG